jgi:hypothetical protein
MHEPHTPRDRLDGVPHHFATETDNSVIRNSGLDVQSFKSIQVDHEDPLLFDTFAQESVCTITVERRSD